MASAKSPGLKVNTEAKTANDATYSAQLASGAVKITYTGSTNTDVFNDGDYYQYMSMGCVKTETYNAGALVSTTHALNWGSQVVYVKNALI